MERAPSKVDTRIYLYLGMAIDLLHIPLVILFVVLGAGWFPGDVFATLIAIVVIFQVATLGCPVLAFTGWLKQHHDPTFENHWSFTAWLYQHYGRRVGIAVFVFFLGGALVVRQFL